MPCRSRAELNSICLDCSTTLARLVSNVEPRSSLIHNRHWVPPCFQRFQLLAVPWAHGRNKSFLFAFCVTSGTLRQTKRAAIIQEYECFHAKIHVEKLALLCFAVGKKFYWHYLVNTFSSWRNWVLPASNSSSGKMSPPEKKSPLCEVKNRPFNFFIFLVIFHVCNNSNTLN